MNVTEMKKLMKKYNELDKQLDDLMDDYTEAGMDKFEKICDKRDAIGEKMISMMMKIGIDRKTANAMLLNIKRREQLTALLNRAA